MARREWLKREALKDGRLAAVIRRDTARLTPLRKSVLEMSIPDAGLAQTNPTPHENAAAARPLEALCTG